MGDMNGGGNASADDDMSDLFRSFLVDGDDILTASGGTGVGHSGGSGNQTGGTSVDLAQPPGFGLRVGGCAPGMRISGQDAEAVGATLIRRRCNTSPDLEDTGGAGGSQVRTQECQWYVVCRNANYVRQGVFGIPLSLFVFRPKFPKAKGSSV